MMTIRRFIHVAGAGLLAASLATVAIAAADDDQDQKDVANVARAKTTLFSAVQTAEQKVGGKAVSADLGEDNGVLSFEIEVVKDNAVQVVVVDAGSGAVTKVESAKDEENDEGDDDDSKGD